MIDNEIDERARFCGRAMEDGDCRMRRNGKRRMVMLRVQKTGRWRMGMDAE